MARVRGLLVSAWVAGALALVSPAASAFKCDVDANGFIDLRDLTLIQQAVQARSPVTGPDDPRDADNNGVINSIDGRLCALRCKYPGCASNGAPKADAGPDQTVRVTDSVTLSGAASSDPDGDALRYTWTLLSRPAGSVAALTGGDTLAPRFVADRPGSYVAQLVVHDGKLASAADTVTVSTVNSAPVAHAGPAQTVFVASTVTLDGRLSSDVDGDPLTFAWEMILKPPGSFAALSDPTAVQPRFVVDLPGNYQVQLIVSDGRLQSRPSSVTISTQNSPPVARPGSNRSVPLGARVELDGSASSDVDGDALGFAWSITSKPAPSGAAIDNPAAARASFVADRPGAYVVQLIVNDGSLASAPATVTITTDNAAPLANAGPDQSVPLGALVRLDGSASNDPEAAVLRYAWALTSKPAGSTAAIDDPSATQPGFTADKPGNYVAQLIVSDGSLASAPDTVVISTENSRPVADPGAAQNVDTGSTVQLDASSSRDADGDALEFSWSLTTRPPGSTASLSNPGAARPSFTADKDGSYIAQLIVSDGKLASVPATVTIQATTPNRAPLAQAQASPTAPTVGNEVTLTSTGSHDPDGDTITYRWAILARPAGSTAEVADRLAANTRFTPDLEGLYVVELLVSDGLLSQTAQVSVTATRTNRAPIAADDNFSTVAGRTLDVPAPGVLGNDVDPDNDPLVAQLTMPPRRGSLVLGADGSIRYTRGATGRVVIDFDDIDTAAANMAPVSSRYRCSGVLFSTNGQPATVVRDGYSGNGATSPPNSLVFFVSASATTATFVDPASGAPATTGFVSAVVGDRSGEPDLITMTAYGLNGAVIGSQAYLSRTTGDFGTVTISAPGIHRVVFTVDNTSGANVDDFTFDPVADTDCFSYKANDGQLDSNVATVVIALRPVNRAPTIEFAGLDPQWSRLAPAGPAPAARSHVGSAYDVVNDRFIVFGGGDSASAPLNEVWVLANATGRAGLPEWSRLAPPGALPPARALASTVYDPTANRLIIRGGCPPGCHTPIIVDTWVLTNANGLGGTPQWIQLPAGDADFGAGHAYDPLGNRLMVFGGTTSGGPFTDTNATRVLIDANGIGNPRWLTLSPLGTAPPPRSELQGLGYDSTHNRLIVFGGYRWRDIDYNDVWVLKNANGLGGTPEWQQLLPAGEGPAPRMAMSSHYDPNGNRLIVFGGLRQSSNPDQVFGDTWVLSNANGLGGVPTWTQLQLPSVNPGPRRSHATGYDPQSNRLVMAFGEHDTAASPFFADAWVQDNASGNCTAGRRCNFRIIASDPNAGDVLTYALQSGPDSLVLDPSTGDMQWTPTIAQIGDHTVTVRVTDQEGLFATQTFTVTVAAVAVPNVVGLAPEWAESFIGAADLTVGTKTSQGGAITLNFDSLPSRQAWTFGGPGFSAAPFTEEELFRVDGTALYQNTLGVGTRAAGYAMTSGVDARLPLTLAVRARVTAEESATAFNHYGFGFDAWTGSSLLGNNLFGVGLGTDAVLVGDDPSNTVLPFDNTRFHDYVMFARPGDSIRLTIDGVPFHAGRARVFPEVPSYALALGDLTQRPNARAEVTAFSFTQARVVGQSPPAGTLVPNKTAVDLIIVDGPATETVPSVIGLTQPAATAAITAAKLVLGPVTSAPHPTIPAGQVADQSPLPGIKVPPNTPVAIVMSTGPPANVAPVITSAPVLAARVGQAYAYAVVATDANGDVLSYTLHQAPAGMVIDAGTGQISWTPAAGQVGPQGVTVRVTDPAGLFDQQSFTITVSPASQPPAFTSTPVTTAAVGQPYRYDADATDPDDTVSYSLTTAPAGMSIVPASGLIGWTPTAAQLGPHTVTVRATDPGGLFDEQSFTVTVAPAPRPPVFTSTPVTAATAGQPYVYDVDATDPDAGDTLSYSLPTAPAGMAIDSASGLITWTPAAAQVGSHAVSVRVQDAGGLFTLQDFNVTVAAGLACAAPPAGLQSWWPGEGNGSDRANVNHAVPEGGAGFAAGRVGQAFRFDGVDDQLRVAHSRTTGFAGPFSVEFWFNPSTTIDATSRNQVLLAKGRYLEGGFNAPVAIQVLGGDGRLLVRMPPAPALVSTTATWPAGTWQHVALTWDGARYRLYVNGVEEAGLDNGFSIVDNTEPITLGNADGFAAAGFAGLLDEVSLVGRALGAAEVAALHGAGSLGKCTATYSRADAGADQAVGLGAAVTLDGSASRAFDGAALAYQWQLVTRPANSAAVLSDATAVQPGFTADREGDYEAELIVTNAGRASAPDRVRISATNHPPQINSVAPTAATAGAPYSYAVIATDPDPGVLAYALPQAPAGMTIGAAGLVAWTPTDAQVGNQPVTVRVTDPAGLFADQAFIITVLPRPQPVAVPNLVGLEEAAARAALTAANLVAGTVTTASSDTVPAGRVISHNPVAGTLVPRGSAVDLVVSSGPPQPTVVAIRITPQAPLILTGQTQAFSATGILSNGSSLPLTTGLTWTSSNPAVAGINAAGVASALAAGSSTITVTQGAASGSTTLAVEQAVADGTLPVAQITAPADGASVSAAVPIVGTASDANFLKYLLEIAPYDTGAYTPIATGTAPVVNGTLATLDPTTLVNDLYLLRLTVFDKADNRSSTEISVQVTREKKVGNFTLAFQDVNVPVAGIPISVVRSYDSRDKARGDFGIGWRLDVNSLRLRVTGVLGQGWQQVQSGGVLNRRYNLVATRSHKVAITLPDGKVEEFDMTVSPSSQALAPILVVDAGFAARPNTVGSLRALGETRLVTQGVVGSLDLLTENGFEVFNPQAYEYTTPEGQVITLSRTQGVTQIRDRNGNTVSFGPGGILHSAGKSISFARDGQGRITSVTDPLGHVQSYAYDVNGDLASHTDALGNRTSYLYNFSHGLIEITDPRGVRPIRNDYDEAGRLISTTDAFGKTITYTHDLGANREVITDRLGNQTIHVYDDQGNVTQTADALGGVTTRGYDGRGNTLTETDPLGRTRSHTYDGQDNRLTETDPLGKVTRYTYNGTRQVLTVTDALGRVTSNAYDAAGNLTQSTDPAGHTTTYAYDARGLQTLRTDPAGNVTRYAYDASGHLASETDALGRVTSYSYDAAGNRLTQATTRTVNGTPQLLTTTFVYDANNRLTQTTHPDGSVTRVAYNAIGKQEKTTDALGRETRYEYDAMGRLARTTYPDGTSESSSYDAEGRRSTSTDRAGRSTTYAYDALGRLTATTFADGSSTATAYDAAGQVLSSTDARGNTTAYQYDAAGRRTRVTDAAGAATQFFYDDLGNQTRVLDANGNPVQFEYDANNRRTRTVYADGSTDQVAYDALGRQVAKTDQAGITTQYGYDALGRLIRVTDALGQVTSYTYDEQGSQLTQTDAEGRTTSFAYDSMGRRIRRTLPLGMSESMSYDAAGNLKTKTDFNGKTTTYAYDSVNRLLAKTPDASLPGQAPIAFSYTASGQRATMSDASGVTSYSYDIRDRLTTKATPQGTLNYSYDAAGNVTRIRSARVGGADMSYAWDARNRLASVTDANGATTYRYDLAGNLQSFLYPNGVEHRYTYNSLNRLTNLIGARGATTIASYTYTLGPAGNRTGVTEANGRRVDYSYDALYRLTGETISADPSGPNGTIGYVYDRVGNRLTRASTVSGIDAQVFAYDGNDRITTEVYDANGNTLGSGGRTFGYDFENRLVSADGGVSFVYNGDGIRVGKTAGGVTTSFLVDDRNPTGYAQVVEEIQGGDNSTVYTVGRNVISKKLPTGVYSYSVFDGLGSVRATNQADAGFVAIAPYEGFGASLGSAVADLHHGFRGEIFDTSVNSYYLRDRYYSPGRGRFLGADRYLGDLRAPASLNRFVYAESDPVNRLDPTGRFTLAEVSITVSVLNIQTLYATKVLVPTFFRAVNAGACVIEPAATQRGIALAAIAGGAGSWAHEMEASSRRNIIVGLEMIKSGAADAYKEAFEYLQAEGVRMKVDVTSPALKRLGEELVDLGYTGKAIEVTKYALAIHTILDSLVEAYSIWRAHPSKCSRARLFTTVGQMLIDRTGNLGKHEYTATARVGYITEEAIVDFAASIPYRINLP